MTAQEIKAALFDRYCMPEWATVDEVPNGIMGNRRIDVLTMNLYPSKNQEIIGFEIKVSRQDLKKELLDGSKSDAIARYCDKFFLVIPKDLDISDFDLPSTWGVITFDGQRLKVKSRGNVMQNQTTISRNFIAAFLQAFFRERNKEINNKIVEVKNQAYFEIEEKAERKFNELKAGLNRDSKAVELAQEIRGLAQWRDMQQIVDMVKVALELNRGIDDFDNIMNVVQHKLNKLQEIKANICEIINKDEL